jgi:hypothetical protein
VVVASPDWLLLKRVLICFFRVSDRPYRVITVDTALVLPKPWDACPTHMANSDGPEAGTGRDGTGRDGPGRAGTGRAWTGRDGTGRAGGVVRGRPLRSRSVRHRAASLCEGRRGPVRKRCRALPARAIVAQ